MISVLIPTYNYNVYPLSNEIHKQLEKTGIAFEILVYDDASTQHFETENLLKELPFLRYKKMPENLGRLALRYQMAQDAQYDTLLMIDADMFPKDRFFAVKLLKTIEKQTADVYFGGLQVPVYPPSPDKTLRWKYGKERESIPLERRRQNPYQSILCGSIALKKDVFLADAKALLPLKKYGLDVYFSYIMQQNNRKVYHYQNPIMHLGLETNAQFLAKTRNALDTYHYLVQNRMMPASYIKLTRIAEKIKKFSPAFITRLPYKLFNVLLEKQLLSSRPGLFVFDLYKLFYYLQLK